MFVKNNTKIDLQINSNTQMDSLGHGKKSIALNLKDPRAIKILKQLCKNSDVLIEPYRPGVMESLGLGPSDLMKENKRLIYSRLTGFGQNGPLSKRAGHDINYVALSGLLSFFGRHNEKPIFPVNMIADFGGGGLLCALGIVLALFERSNSGLGQIIDANMVDGSSYLGSFLYRSQYMPIWGQERGKNILDSGAHFYEVYETKDGKFMSVGAIEAQFYKELLKGLGLNEDEVPHFGDFEESKKVFEKKFLEKTQKEWCEIFDKIDACVMPILTIEEAVEHPHNVNSFVKNEENNVYVPKPAPKLNRTPGLTKGDKRLPQIGENTEEVLKKLNYSEQDITELESDGIISRFKKSKI